LRDFAEQTVLMADDDEDDCMLARKAFEESKTHGAFLCVEDGDKLMDYLLCSVESDAEDRQKLLPALILLDLNMPRKDGRQALREIKAIPAFKNIPIVILTTSRDESDISFSREMGANSFITKPNEFYQWVEIIESLAESWLK
jgi:CheY-like chemotaxis protein